MKRFFIKTLADLRFAILLLLLIAIFSIFGTIIEQDQTIEQYQNNYPITNTISGFLNWKVIIQLGLDHVYKTWWFISLLIIFSLSLLSCTFLQQLPSLKIAKRCQFFKTQKQFKKLKNFYLLEKDTFSYLIYLFNKNNYSIFQQQNLIYCYKGLIGRLAPIIVHISMILILLGAVIGAIGGFTGQEIIPKHETFNIQNIINKGSLTTIPKINTRVNDFWITYNQQTTIDQFYSNISFLNNFGKEINNQTISVNHPAKYKGTTYYQTDWNLIGLRVKLNNNEIIQYPLISPFTAAEKIWVSWIPFNDELDDGITVVINNLQGYISLYDKTGKFISNLELNETIQLTKEITLIDIMSSTGLQIKTDPGIYIIYTGFGLLMISTLISYQTYSQLWILKNNGKIYLGGNTTRAKYEFEIEFQKLINQTK